MSKKTHNRLLTDAFREIRKTRSRFLSLFLLSALAVAFLAGLRTTAPDMERTADRYFDNQNLMDLHILSTLGLTEEDIRFLAAQPGVRSAEGAYTVDAMVHMEQNDLIVKLLSLSPTGINAPELVEGRLPENGRECVVEPKLLKSAGLSIGDAITFDTGDGNFENALKYGSYTVVGTVNSPLYISVVQRGSSSLGSGQASAFAILSESAFDMDYYTDGYLLAHNADGLFCYSDAYDSLIDALKDQLEPLSDQRAPLRYDEVVGGATETLDDAQKEFDDAEAEANQTLEDADQELKDARKELDDGWAEYDDGVNTLQRETADAEQKISDAQGALPDAKKQLDDAKQELDDGETAYTDGVRTLEDGKAAYTDGLQTWLDGKKEYDVNFKKLQDGQREYDDGLQEYRDGLVALEDGAGQLSAARRELDGAGAELSSGAAQLEEGRKQLEEAQKMLALAEDAYDAAGTALLDLLAWIDPNLTPDSSDEEIADAINRYLDETLTAESADQAAEDIRDWVHTLPQDLLDQLPDGVLDAIDSLTGEDLLSGKEAAKSHMLEAIEAARQGEAEINAQLDALRKQVADGQAQLDDGEAALASGRAQYHAGKKQYNEALAQFDDSVLRLQDAYDQLTDAKAELDDGWKQLSDGKQELEDGQKELEDNALVIAAGETELIDARKKLDDGWVEYHDGVQAYEDGAAELENAKNELPTETAKARKKLNDAHDALQDGEREYADGLVAYEDGRREADDKLSDARRKLNDARREIAEIEHCEWYVLGRNTNMGYVSYQQDAERMGNLASVFPLIFFLVAALVCLTTMTRMVEEQRVQIGGMKALGYSKGAIALKYVGYGFLASFLGGVTGLIVGCLSIPWVIVTAWKILYTVGALVIPVYPGISLLSVGAAVLCVTGTAFAACFATLHAVPADLMRPRAPKPGKRVLLERIKPLWRHMSFTWKVTARNLFRYQRRFWMTVIGIGGCTALIIAGFGIRDSIHDMLSLQFDDISPYSAQVSLADNVTDDEMLEIARVLNTDVHVLNWMPCYDSSLSAEGPKRTTDAYLFAVEDIDAFQNFIHLRHRLDDESVTLPSEGAVLTEKLADMLGVGPGGVFTLDGDKRAAVTVADTTENYVLHYIYISAGYYEQLFGAPPATNTILVHYTDETRETADEVSSQLIALSGVSSVSRVRETRDTFSKSMATVDYAVIVVILAAAALAFVVLFNLTNINITERMRELATLKVLGFYDGELSSYVYRENIFLTLFGVALGLVMGKFLHQWLVLTVEIDMVMFGRTAQPASYLYAVLLTLFFSLLVNFAARKKLKKIDMVESLKTVE